MRIIAGTLRSRQLVAPPGSTTRPTSDRLRETLFNVLGPRVSGCCFADLYAGTGAVGLEAISRGAAQVLFVEKARPALAALRENLRSLGIQDGYSLEERSVAAALKRRMERVGTPPGVESSPFDVVFLDPPYDASAEYTATLDLLGSHRAVDLLAPGALVVAEHSSRSGLPERVNRLTRSRVLRQGDATLSFYSVGLPDGEPA